MIGYYYDGNFEGFLTCVFYAYARKEDPAFILPFNKKQALLIPSLSIATESDKARRVENGIKRHSEEGYQMLRDGFLCAISQKESLLLAFSRLILKYGNAIIQYYPDPTISALRKAIASMQQEGHLLEGFLRFSEHQGVLTSIISPKNQVLPILATHFSKRFPNESFMIYDKNHKVGFLHTITQHTFLEIEQLTLPPTEPEEAAYQAMWKSYFAHISIRERENPACQRTHLSMRYRPWMTEFSGPVKDFKSGKTGYLQNPAKDDILKNN